jgi:hypothetical protein
LAMILDHFPRVSLLPGDLLAIMFLSCSISKILCLLSNREHFNLSNLKISRQEGTCQQYPWQCWVAICQ